MAVSKVRILFGDDIEGFVQFCGYSEIFGMQIARKYICKICLTYPCDTMHASVIKVSSKGQIVIPAAWRKSMDLKEGEELIAIGDGDTLVIKKIGSSTLKQEFDETTSKIRERIKELGITRDDVKEAVKKAREN
ncbi:MAG: AbrB/MazE/SpoVT family DNA-binding domain-containing protein [Candidatus Thermoplasmatota archaeon]|nr:AbrB/MazE/SpoVT family DNA-binding domain-containing protein [Candidatus Thermoplasmatota archaeon]